jgi:hypothetical protein
MKKNDLARAWALSFAGACALTAATAAEPQRQKSPEVAPAVAEAQALRVVRDKATGRLRAPTSDELKAMDATERAARKARGLPEVAESTPLNVTRHASGTLSARLTPDYLVTLRAERQPDGTLKQTHDNPRLEHPVAARHALPTE